MLRAWFIPSNGVLARVDWRPLTAAEMEREIEDAIRRYLSILHRRGESSPEQDPKVQAFIERLEDLKGAFRPGVPERVRRRAEKELMALEFGLAIGDALSPGTGSEDVEQPVGRRSRGGQISHAGTY